MTGPTNNLNFANQNYFHPTSGNSVTHAMSGVSGISILSGGNNDVSNQSTTMGYTNKLGMKILPNQNK